MGETPLAKSCISEGFGDSILINAEVHDGIPHYYDKLKPTGGKSEEGGLLIKQLAELWVLSLQLSF